MYCYLFFYRYHGDCISISEKEAKLIKQYFCVRCTEEDSTLQTRWKTKRDESGPIKDEHRSRKRKERAENKSDKKQKRCGECVGCCQVEDCGLCDVCLRKKQGSYSRIKEKCKQRICLVYGGYLFVVAM